MMLFGGSCSLERAGFALIPCMMEQAGFDGDQLCSCQWRFRMCLPADTNIPELQLVGASSGGSNPTDIAATTGSCHDHHVFVCAFLFQ